ncbi:MAG TPA: hypothetical protein VMA71_09315 [Alloacidobacterium sp.]|nr:hypothetical protein [Alloacidobacterium sp.]
MRRIYALLLLAINLCAINAVAEKRWRVTVPFDFDANGRSLPAGAYDITFDIATQLIAVSRSRDATNRLQWFAIRSGFQRPQATLSFGKVGNNYTLKSVMIGQWETPVRAHPRSRALTVPISAGSDLDLCCVLCDGSVTSEEWSDPVLHMPAAESIIPIFGDELCSSL